MSIAWSITYAALVPVACLGLLLWLAHLEDGLTPTSEGAEIASLAGRATPTSSAEKARAFTLSTGAKQPATSFGQVADPSGRLHRASKTAIPAALHHRTTRDSEPEPRSR